MTFNTQVYNINQWLRTVIAKKEGALLAVGNIKTIYNRFGSVNVSSFPSDLQVGVV